jgi:hypothetical protein
VKTATMLVCIISVVLIAAAIWLADNFIAPLSLDSRVERLGEASLPKIMVENGNTIYCRMKADDFRFPLPPISRATNLIITGGFDTVDGCVEAQFESTNQITVAEYKRLLSGQVQTWGQIFVEEISGGFLIKFHYFGDK